MNYNLIGYILYLSITAYIIVVIGKICYKNGNVFVSELVPNHMELCHQVNQVLLIGFYLLNIGYSATTLIKWNTILSVPELIETISINTAIIISIISILHYLNIIMLTKYLKKLIN